MVYTFIMLHKELKNKISVLLKEKNETQLLVVRAIITNSTNLLIEQGKKPDNFLDDNDVLGIIKKMIKQGNDSYEKYETNNRKDLADKEKKELDFLKSFLPEELSIDKVKNLITTHKEKLNITDKSKSGMLIGIIIKENKDLNINSSLLSKLVNESFN